MTVAPDAGYARILDRVTERASSRAAAQRAVSNLMASRQKQELASREIESGMLQLAAMGVTQRDIAALAGLSQAEVSRRLKRAHLSSDVEKVREIILRRADGGLSSAAMVTALAGAVGARRTPGRISAHDGASTSSRALAELAKHYKAGAITRHEYEGVRRRLGERLRAR